MAKKIGRRTVYIGTIVGALALVGGFAMAASFTSTPVSSGQNGFSANLGNTVWYGSTVTLSPGASQNGCTANAGVNTPSAPKVGSTFAVTLGTAASITVYFGMNSTSTSSCLASNFAETWAITQTFTSAASDTDTFVVYASWTPYDGTLTSAVSAYQLPMAITGSGSSAVTVNLVLDFGSNVPPTSISSLDVVVSGS